jgi:pyruvate dehydrogenase E1 component beta subunit
VEMEQRLHGQFRDLISLLPFNKEWKEVGYKRIVIKQITLYFTGEAFYHLDAPVVRVTGVDTPMPYTKSLEAAALPQPHDIVRAVKRVLNVK